MRRTKIAVFAVILALAVILGIGFTAVAENESIGIDSAVAVDSVADKLSTSPPVIDTSGLELWDGTYDIIWYIEQTNAGKGNTENNPYEIENARELAGLNEIIKLGGQTVTYNNDKSSQTYGKFGNNFVSIGTITMTNFSNKYLKLTKDIHLNTWNGDTAMEADDFSNNTNGGAAREWVGINNINGTFDGNNKNIIGLVQGGSLERSGFFGGLYSQSIVIKNLTVQSGNLSTASTNYTTRYAGGIVGFIEYYATSSIINCVNYCKIEGYYSYSVGGIVGNSASLIANCINYGEMAIVRANNVGGIAGIAVDSSGWGDKLNILRCVNYGKISPTDIGGTYTVGGIVGENNNGTVEECYNLGNVSGSHNVGGIVGLNSASSNAAKIVGCYNLGAISGTENIGGIVGENTATTYSATNIAGVSYSYNAGTVSGTTNVGGVIGYDEKGTIKYCYYDMDIANGLPAIGNTTSIHTFGLTTAQMKNSGSYAAEFVNVKNSYGKTIWKFGANDYPQLLLSDIIEKPIEDEEIVPPTVGEQVGQNNENNTSGGGNESHKIDPIFIGVAVVIGLAIAIGFYRKRKTLRIEKVTPFAAERTPEQKELFYKSYAFLSHMQGLKKAKIIVYVEYAVSAVLWVVGLIVGLVASTDYGYFLVGAAAFILLVGLYIAAQHAKTRKRMGLQGVREWKKEDCIKCGGNNAIVKSEFARTDSEIEEKVISGSYRGDGEVIRIFPRYNESKKKNEQVAQIKFTYYYYNVTRKCEQCGEVSTAEELSKTPPQPETNIYVETAHFENTQVDTVTVETPKPLPMVFCQFCGGKNLGEATKCEHCGGKIFKE